MIAAQPHSAGLALPSRLFEAQAFQAERWTQLPLLIRFMTGTSRANHSAWPPMRNQVCARKSIVL